MVPIGYYLVLSAVLFVIGGVGVLSRRNPLQMFMAVELMWNAVNLSFVAFARQYLDMAGHIFVFLVITVAAAEVAIGLAIIVMVFRKREHVDVDDLSLMKG
jgi:NADH-quinone oxidoreductase subunit K